MSDAHITVYSRMDISCRKWRTNIDTADGDSNPARIFMPTARWNPEVMPGYFPLQLLTKFDLFIMVHIVDSVYILTNV